MSTVILKGDTGTVSSPPKELAFSQKFMDLALNTVGKSREIQVIIDKSTTTVIPNAFEDTGNTIKTIIRNHFLPPSQ